MRGVTRDVLTVGLAFATSSVLTMFTAAQFDPGWRPAGTAPQLNPRPDPATREPASAVEQTQILIPFGGTSRRGWLVRPAGEASSLPGLILVAGAGSADRDTLLPQARALAAHGIVTLTYDKRADGYSWRTRDFQTLADDAVRAADALAAQAQVDASRIGVLGWSEGGWVAPLAVATRPKRFAYLILVSASIVSPLEQASWMVDRRIEALPQSVRRTAASVLASGRHVVDYLDFDVAPALARLQVPAYAVWGELDTAVPVAIAARRLIETTEAPVTVRIVQDGRHDPGQTWITSAAAWIGHPAPADQVLGVEPHYTTGVPRPPTGAWFTNPVAQLVFSAAAALALALMLRLRRRHASP
jgi:pimeloyl-ACP methyl ester carboxylesterase